MFSSETHLVVVVLVVSVVFLNLFDMYQSSYAIILKIGLHTLSLHYERGNS